MRIIIKRMMFLIVTSTLILNLSIFSGCISENFDLNDFLDFNSSEAIPALNELKTGESNVLVDIYVRTNKFNGLKQYKKVVKR